MLFREFTRTDHSISQATESDFAFLDRCAWQSVERIRQVIEVCLHNYPEKERAELISRLRSGDERHFRSGTFELFLHEYLLRQGFELQPHPELANGSNNRPDFKVICPDGAALYLEAVSAADDDGTDAAGEARIAVALQALNDVAHPYFMVSVKWLGYPASQPSGRRLAAEVARWLNDLNADEVLKKCESGLEDLPEMRWEHEDWKLQIKAIPVKVEYRSNPRPLIGMRGPSDGAMIDGWTPIREAIISKSRRYGELDLPLVVAVNVKSFSLDRIDEMQALFGQEQYLFRVGELSAEPEFRRVNNGAWGDQNGPRSRRCSGAWLFHNLLPWSIANRHHTLYLHPWANHAIPGSFLCMPHALVIDGRMQRVEGKSLQEVFELRPEWPDQ